MCEIQYLPWKNEAWVGWRMTGILGGWLGEYLLEIVTVKTYYSWNRKGLSMFKEQKVLGGVCARRKVL